MRALLAVALTGLFFAPATAQATDYEPVVKGLDAEIPRIMAEHKTVGLTLALVDGDQVLVAKGYGYADRARRSPVTSSTLFHIGSISKTLSATAVMKLVEQGKVDLDSPVSRYIPQFRMLPRYKRNWITVRTILDHHSGIPGDIFNGGFTHRAPNPDFLDSVLKDLRRMVPERRVNRLWAYNNSGYVILQRLVENVTGEPFETWTHDNLFAPMGMTSSSYDDAVAPNGALTRNYWVDGKRIEPRPREYINAWAAGSVLSNAEDMAGYLRMVVSGGQPVVRPDTFAQMLTPQTHLPLDIFEYRGGLGWFMQNKTWSGKVALHDGGTAYNFSMMKFLPDSGLGVFVSTNTIGGSEVSDQVADLALSSAYTAKTGISKPDVAPLPTAAHVKAGHGGKAGLWATSFGYDRLVRSNGRLRWISATGAARIRPMSNRWWSVAGEPATQVRFRTIEGRRLMIARVASVDGPQKHVVGRYLPANALSSVWQSRLGRYRATDYYPNNIGYLVPETVRMSVAHGALMLRLPDRIQVLKPAAKNVAHTYGVGAALGRDKGDGVFFNGKRFRYMGVRYSLVEPRH